MIKYVSAVLIDGDDGVLVCHKKNTEMINQNWCLPCWDYDFASSLTPEEYLFQKLGDHLGIKKIKLIIKKEVEQILFFVIKIQDTSITCIGDSYDLVEFQNWVIVRDFTDDNYFQIYSKLFLKIQPYLESPYKRYFRIIIKFIAALILFLLPFAVLWKFIGNN